MECTYVYDFKAGHKFDKNLAREIIGMFREIRSLSYPCNDAYEYQASQEGMIHTVLGTNYKIVKIL